MSWQSTTHLYTCNPNSSSIPEKLLLDYQCIFCVSVQKPHLSVTSQQDQMFIHLGQKSRLTGIKTDVGIRVQLAPETFSMEEIHECKHDGFILDEIVEP